MANRILATGGATAAKQGSRQRWSSIDGASGAAYRGRVVWIEHLRGASPERERDRPVAIRRAGDVERVSRSRML